MSTDPDQIRADIERTRAELSENVDALSDKVSPSAAVDRRKQKLRSSFASVKDRVMGTTHEKKESLVGTAHGAKESVGSGVGSAVQGVGSGVSSAAHGVGSGVSSAASGVSNAAQELPATVRRQTEGNPLAAGLIAFGAGWLAASLLPASEREKQAAAAVKDQAMPLVEGAKGIASDVAGELRQPAQDAVQAVKDRAAEAASSLKDEGASEAQGIKEDAKAAKDAVQDQHGGSDAGSQYGSGSQY